MKIIGGRVAVTFEEIAGDSHMWRGLQCVSVRKFIGQVRQDDSIRIESGIGREQPRLPRIVGLWVIAGCDDLIDPSHVSFESHDVAAIELGVEQQRGERDVFVSDLLKLRERCVADLRQDRIVSRLLGGGDSERIVLDCGQDRLVEPHVVVCGRSWVIGAGLRFVGSGDDTHGVVLQTRRFAARLLQDSFQLPSLFCGASLQRGIKLGRASLTQRPAEDQQRRREGHRPQNHSPAQCEWRRRIGSGIESHRSIVGR